MTFRAPLFVEGEINFDIYELLTDKQKAKLFDWAFVLKKQPKEMLASAKFMAEQVGDTDEVRLVGELPNCKQFGSLDPDGSSNT